MVMLLRRIFSRFLFSHVSPGSFRTSGGGEAGHSEPVYERSKAFHRSWVFYLWLCLMAVAVIMLSLGVEAAVDTRTLYQVRVPVADQDPEKRQPAFEQAFEQVMKKLTGRSDVMTLADFSQIPAQVGKMVSQFHYREVPKGERATFEQKYSLQVRFNSSVLSRIIRENHLPLWGGDRPPVLVWIVTEESGHRQIITPQDKSVLRDNIASAAESWGVRTIFPLVDFEDSGALSVSELWGLFEESISGASARYGANAVLAIQASQVGRNRWHGRSLFLFRGRHMSHTYTGDSPAGLSEKAIAGIARTMSDAYAVTAGSALNRPVRIEVANITTVEAYSQLTAFLSDLTAVRSVTPVVVKGARMVMDVTIDGTVEQLSAAIGLGRHLVPVVPPPDTGRELTPNTDTNPPQGAQDPVPQNVIDLHYRWRQAS